MDRKGFTEYLSGRDTPEEKIGIYLDIADRIENKRASESSPIKSAEIDLFSQELVRKGVLERVGTTGKGTHYIIKHKGLTKGSKGS